MPEFKINAPTPCLSENIQNPYLDRGMYACKKVRRDEQSFCETSVNHAHQAKREYAKHEGKR